MQDWLFNNNQNLSRYLGPGMRLFDSDGSREENRILPRPWQNKGDNIIPELFGDEQVSDGWRQKNDSRTQEMLTTQEMWIDDHGGMDPNQLDKKDETKPTEWDEDSPPTIEEIQGLDLTPEEKATIAQTIYGGEPLSAWVDHFKPGAEPEEKKEEEPAEPEFIRYHGMLIRNPNYVPPQEPEKPAEEQQDYTDMAELEETDEGEFTMDDSTSWKPPLVDQWGEVYDPNRDLPQGYRYEDPSYPSMIRGPDGFYGDMNSMWQDIDARKQQDDRQQRQDERQAARDQKHQERQQTTQNYIQVVFNVFPCPISLCRL